MLISPTLADNFELQISPGSSRTKLNQLTGRHHFNECANLFEPEYVESHVQYVKELHPLNSLKIATFRLVDDELQTLRQFFELSWNCCHHLTSYITGYKLGFVRISIKDNLLLFLSLRVIKWALNSAKYCNGALPLFIAWKGAKSQEG